MDIWWLNSTARMTGQFCWSVGSWKPLWCVSWLQAVSTDCNSAFCHPLAGQLLLLVGVIYRRTLRPNQLSWSESRQLSSDVRKPHNSYVVTTWHQILSHYSINPLKSSFVIWLHLECLAPSRSNLPFLISDIWALWRSGLSTRVPEYQKLKW